MILFVSKPDQTGDLLECVFFWVLIKPFFLHFFLGNNSFQISKNDGSNLGLLMNLVFPKKGLRPMGKITRHSKTIIWSKKQFDWKHTKTTFVKFRLGMNHLVGEMFSQNTSWQGFRNYTSYNDIDIIKIFMRRILLYKSKHTCAIQCSGSILHHCKPSLYIYYIHTCINCLNRYNIFLGDHRLATALPALVPRQPEMQASHWVGPFWRVLRFLIVYFYLVVHQC